MESIESTFEERIARYIGRHIKVVVIYNRYTRAINGILREVTKEYITLSDVENTDGKIIIRTPWIVSVEPLAIEKGGGYRRP